MEQVETLATILSPYNIYQNVKNFNLRIHANMSTSQYNFFLLCEHSVSWDRCAF